jgi:isopentenyl-diphosphate delta-isomerase
MEQVILVNEQDEVVGTMEKMEAHQKAALHRAFSVFIFNDRGEMLLQQRALNKYHSPGLWTNSCCSHPRPGEDTTEAASRRLEEEMGFTTALQEIFSFIYRADFDNGLTEHELDHVLVGYYKGPVQPNKQEVNDQVWWPMQHIETSIAQEPEKFTVWFRIAFPKIKAWRAEHPVEAS